MVRSYPRNNFLDILRDPLAVTIMASIALHAAIGAYLLPIITKTQPEGKKAEPGTVKVVELTPNELQRIPQAPAPIPTPTPAPTVLPPVYQPSPPVAPSSPKFSTSIPISPVRTPPKQTPTNTPKGSKNLSTKIPAISPGVDFNPEVFATPSPKPSKSPSKPGKTSKAAPQPTVKPSIKPTQPATKPPTKTSASPKPTSTPEQPSDDDGGGQNPTATQPTTPPKTNQPPVATPSPTISGSPSPSSESSPPSSNPTGGQGTGFYGKYTQSAIARRLQYERENPGIKTYQPKIISQKYPDGVPCSNVKQPPFIVLMVAFGKVPQSQENNILGDSTAPSIDKPYVAGDNDTPTNKKLAAIAADAALYEANKSDQTRPEADKNKPVLYQYRVQFDPATCKN